MDSAATEAGTPAASFGEAKRAGVAEEVPEGAAEGPTAAVEERLNVILISLDTVRPDHLSCYGYHRDTTPNLDRIAKDGVIFTQAYSQASTTLPSHLSLFTSRYPTRAWDRWETADLDPSTETLTEILKRQGYLTAAFTGFNRKHELFAILLDAKPFREFDKQVIDVNLTTLPDTLFDWLRTHHEEPFFLFLQGFDVHEPHLLPAAVDAKRFNPTYQGRFVSTWEEWDALIASEFAAEDLEGVSIRERSNRERAIYHEHLGAPEHVHPDDLDHLIALYDAQLYYADRGLGRLFTTLDELDLMERTLLVIVSDHGQEFGEHGRYADHWQLYHEVTRMVFIVRDPRFAPGGRTVRQLVQGIDLMPTILDLLGLPVPQSAVGRSLRPFLRTGRDPDREEVAFSVGKGRRAIRTPHWMLLDEAGIPTELYDRASDAQEQHNLISRHPNVVTQLQYRLDQEMSSEVAGELTDPTQWMQEHGYW